MEERKLTKEILLHIAEVDRRRLYLKMAYPSMFDYLTKEIGYSAGAAQRRIDAARLIQKVPEVSEKIKSGSISLSQISKVQKVCRQIKKDTGSKVDVEVQRDVLEKIENKSSVQTDLILAQEFNMETKLDEKKHIQKDESVRVELTFTKEEMELIEKAKAILSNKTGGGLKDTILEMAHGVVVKAGKVVGSSKELGSSQVVGSKPEVATATVAVAANKTVTPKLRKEILNKDQCCQFVDPKTQRKCGSKYFLEVDHIWPKYLGGENNKENLRVLCKNHNIYRYDKMLG